MPAPTLDQQMTPHSPDLWLLKGSIDYGKWVDKSFVDAAEAQLAAVQ